MNLIVNAEICNSPKTNGKSTKNDFEIYGMCFSFWAIKYQYYKCGSVHYPCEFGPLKPLTAMDSPARFISGHLKVYSYIIIFLKQNSLYLIPGFNIIKKFVATKFQPKIYNELVSFIVYMIIQLKMLFGRQPSS